MIKTIIFDIGGVVTQTDFKAIYSDFAKQIGIAPEFVIDYHKKNLDALLLGEITIEQFWKDMRDAGGNPELDYPAIWLRENRKSRIVNDELLNIIARLRKDYSVGTLTNLSATRLLFDEEINLYSHFDYAVLSCAEHLKKPDPAFYQLALSRASAKPEEAIFVDDKEVAVAVAEKLGIKGILYSFPNNADLLERLNILGVKLDQ